MLTVTKEFNFCAAHYLEGHSLCGQMHGHNYRVLVTLQGGDREDMVVDFGDVKTEVGPIVEQLDHTVLNNKIKPGNPTAENIATNINNTSNYTASATATGASGNPYVSVYYSGSGYIDTTETSVTGTADDSSTSNTLEDSTKSWTNDEWIDYTIAITSGTGSGQSRTITDNDSTTLTVDSSWSTTPDSTSEYAIKPTAWAWKTVNGTDAIATIAKDDSGTLEYQPVFTNSDGILNNIFIEGPDGGKIDIDLEPVKSDYTTVSTYTQDISIPT